MTTAVAALKAALEADPARLHAARDAVKLRALVASASAGSDNTAPWATAKDSIAKSRMAVHAAQDKVRAVAGISDEDLHDAIKERDEARRQHVENLGRCLEMHLSRGAEERRARLQNEFLQLQAAAAASGEPPMGAKLTEQVRLKLLSEVLLPPLDAWLATVGGWREERDELAPHASGTPPSVEEVRALQKALQQAKLRLKEAGRKLEDAEDAKEDGEPSTVMQPLQAEETAARRAVQAAERSLHRARIALARIASAHFPEMLERESLLRLGGKAGLGEEEVRSLLVERKLAHYEREARLSDKDARHEVWKASYDGEACVLKEYKLDDDAEWRELVKEVRLLGQLSHPHIVVVQAVFEEQAPHRGVQLPYYSGGDMLAWLKGTDHEMWRRKALLKQLCEALWHIHGHGYAHGDVKLENVLVALEGEHATAHLADFESARQQRTATRTMSTSTSGGAAFTELYVAPEILAAANEGHDAKPTPAGDMFSYGVCCLFACCLPADVNAQQAAVRRFAVDDQRALSPWSRDAAGKADTHLPDLLESLRARPPTGSARARRSSIPSIRPPRSRRARRRRRRRRRRRMRPHRSSRR